ncbi:MAG: hypothetical protein ABIM19_01050, partial [candidate division WOR-3 bacterium]
MFYFSIAVCMGADYGSWPMWGSDPCHQGLQSMSGAMGTEPVVKWRFLTGPSEGMVEWQGSAIADCDGDGAPEVIMGSWDNKVYCIRGSDGT